LSRIGAASLLTGSGLTGPLPAPGVAVAGPTVADLHNSPRVRSAECAL